MLEFDTRKIMGAASRPSPSPAAASPIADGPATAVAGGADAAAQPIAPAWSPIVVAGIVRMIEFALTVLVGLAIYGAYVVPIDGFEWHYVAAIIGIAVLATARVPGRRHLPGAGVPRLREAVFPARLRLVGGVPDRHRRHVLRQGRRSVLARLARHLLRRRPARPDRLPARAVPARAPLDARRPARPPHRRGRRRRARRRADQVARRAARQRRAHRRRVRRSRRRPLPDRRSPACRSSARSTISSNSHAARASIW